MRASFLLLFTAVAVLGQSGPESAPEAEKYHQMLLKRPQPGLVYDRFYAAWMETGTAETLAAYLSTRTESAADLLVLAIFHEQRGNETEALKAYAAALEKDAKNARAWLQRAKLEARTMEFEKALKSLAESEKAGAEAAIQREIGQLRGRWLLRTGKPDTALQAWRDLLTANANDEDLVEEIVELQLDEGLFAEAAAQMQALISRTADAYTKTVRKLRLADIQLRASKKDDALKLMSDTLADTGQGTWIEGEVLAQIEATFRRDENVSGLAKKLEELQVAHPQRTALDRQRARVLAELGEKDKALAIYAALLQKTPGQRDLRESYLDLLDRFEQFKEAIAQTNVLLEQSPDDRELLIRLATLQERAKDKAASKASLEKFLAAKATTEFDHLRVARLYESWERGDDATAAYERMVAAFPASNAAKEAQAHYLHRSGKRDAALAIWRDLAKNGDLGQLMAVGQALMARLESQAAMEVLQARLSEFERDERFLGLLVNAALGSKKETDAIPWAQARVRATSDASSLDDALRQAVTALKSSEEKMTATLNELRSKPGSVQERILLATLLEETQDRLGAEKVLREMPAEHALAAQTRLVKLLESRQDWLRAAQEAEKLVSLPQGRNSTHVQQLVDLVERAGKPEEALKWVAEWKKLSPGSTTPWLREARLLQQSGKARDALPVLTAAARKFDDDESVADALASAYADLGQMSDAERIYLGLLGKEEKPEDKMRWVATLARLASDRGQLKPLIDKFVERQRTNRGDASPWLALAEIHRVAANTTEQERALREAMRLRPDDVTLALQIARADLDMGRWKQAVEGLERVAVRDKGSRVEQMIASIQIEYGDANKGYRMLYEIAGGAQMAADDALALAKGMTAQQDWKRAASFLEPLVRQHPQDYRLGYLLAVSLEEESRTAEATALFMRLMAQQEELPSITAARKTADTRNAYLEKLKTRMPEGFVDLLRLTDYGSGYLAYSYRSNAIRYSGQTASRAVMAPASLGNLRSMGLAHLVALLKLETTEKQAALIAEAGRLGVPAARYLDIFDLDQYHRLQMSPDALEKHPDDPVVLAQLTSNWDNVSLDTATKAFEAFKTKYPDLAAQAALQAVQADSEKGAPMIVAALEILEKLRVEEMIDVGSAYYYLGAAIGGSQSMRDDARVPTLPEPVRKRMLALMLKSLDRVSPDAGPNPVMKSGLPNAANACRTQQAWREFVDLLEREVRIWREHEPTRQSWTKYASQFNRRSQSTSTEMIKRLPFPGGMALPPMLTLYFSRKDIYNPDPGDKMEPEPEDYAGVKPLLDSVKFPPLRMLLAYKAGDRERVKAEVQKLLDAPNPSVDDLLLAASWLSIEDQYDRVIELLVHVSGMAIPAEVRSSFDAALAHAALKLKQPAGNPGLEPAQMAVRRLRSARVTSEQKEELIAAMKNLGLADEADQWSRVAIVAAPTVTQRSSYSYSSSNIDTKKLQQLAGGKDEEALVKEAVKQLHNAISYMNNNNQSYAISRAKEIMRIASRPAVQAKVKAAFDPGESATTTKLFEHAQFLELIADQAAAQKTLEKIVAVNPQHYDARLRLCALIAQTDPQRAVKLMTEVPMAAFQKSNLGNQIIEMLNRDSSLPFEGRMSITASFAAMLDAAPPGAGVKGLEWMVDLPAIIANQTYREPRLPHLYARPGQSGNDSSERYLPADSPQGKRRREVHDQLCLAFMKHPVLAEEGFRRFACLALQDGGRLDELSNIARKVLEEAKQAPRNSRSTNVTRRYGFYQEVTGFWAPIPAEFLVWRAWKDKQPEKIEQEVMPLAKAALDPAQYLLLQAQAKIWTCPSETFLPAARAYMTTASARGRSSYGQDPFAVWVVDRWEERGLKELLLDDLVAETLKQNRSFSSAYAVQHYIGCRARMKPAEPMEPFLIRVVSAALGDKRDTWVKTMQPTILSYYGRGGSMNNQAAYSLLQTISNLVRNPATFGAGFHMASLVGATDNANWVRNSEYNMAAVLKSPDNLVSALHSLGWAGEAAQLRLPEEPNCLQVTLLKKIRENRDTANDLGSRLAALKPRTFGVEFCEAFLQEAPAPALTALLKRRAADVAMIPVNSGPAIMTLIKSQIPALHQPANADPALVKVLEPFLGAEQKKSLDEIDRWIAATRTDDITTDHEAYDAKLVEALRTLIPTDRDKAEKLFLAACALVEAKERSGGWDGYSSGNGWTARSETFDELLRKMPKIEAIGFVMRLYHTDTTGYLAMNGWSQSSGYGQALMEVWRNNGGGGAMGRGLDAMLKALSTQLGDTPHTLVGIAFHDFFTKLPAAQRVAALNWAVKAPKDHPQAALVKELDFAGRVFLAFEPQTAQNEGTKKAIEAAGGLQPAWEHYRGHLSNKSVNARVRQALAHHLSYKSVDGMDAECAKLGAAAALESQKQKHCLHGYQYAWIMRSFNRLPVDDAWKAAAQEHWDAWLARCNSGGLSAYNPCDWVINSVLRMTAHAGNDDWMREMLRRFHHTLSNEPSGIASLMFGGQPKLAAEHFTAEWRGFLMDPQKELLWSKELVQNLPVFKEACGDPGLAFLGEIYLSYLKDPAKHEQAAIPGFKSRDERFKDLARRFKETKFSNDEMRKDSVEILSQFYDAAKMIHADVDAIAAKTDLNALAAIEETWEHWRQLKPLQFSLGWKAVQGDVQPNIAAYDVALKARYSQSYYQRSAVKETGWGPTWVANWHWSHESEAGREPNIRTVLPFLEHVIAKTPEDLRDLHVADCISQKWLIHVASNEQPVFEKWRQGLSDADKRDFKKRIQDRWEMWDYIRQLAGTQKHMRLSPEQRGQLVAAVARDEWCATKYPATGPGIPNLANDLVQKSRVFKPEEFAAAATPIAEALPRMGRTAGEAADLLAANGKTDAAAGLYALAFQHARTQNEKDYNLAAGYAVKQAEVLERTGKKAEAAQVLAQLDEKRLGTGIKKTREAALKRLQPAG